MKEERGLCGLEQKCRRIKGRKNLGDATAVHRHAKPAGPGSSVHQRREIIEHSLLHRHVFIQANLFRGAFQDSSDSSRNGESLPLSPRLNSRFHEREHSFGPGCLSKGLSERIACADARLPEPASLRVVAPSVDGSAASVGSV